MTHCTDLVADSSASALRLESTRRERAVTHLRLRRLDHRLERSWRSGLARRDARLLAAARDRIGAVPLMAATAVSGASGIGSGIGIGIGIGIAFAELRFADGFVLRLGPCHEPAVALLASAVAAARPVTLSRVTHQRRLWVLDFATTGRGPIPLLAGSAALAGGGGASPSATPVLETSPPDDTVTVVA